MSEVTFSTISTVKRCAECGIRTAWIGPNERCLTCTILASPGIKLAYERRDRFTDPLRPRVVPLDGGGVIIEWEDWR